MSWAVEELWDVNLGDERTKTILLISKNKNNSKKWCQAIEELGGGDIPGKPKGDEAEQCKIQKGDRPFSPLLLRRSPPCPLLPLQPIRSPEKRGEQFWRDPDVFGYAWSRGGVGHDAVPPPASFPQRQC